MYDQGWLLVICVVVFSVTIWMIDGDKIMMMVVDGIGCYSFLVVANGGIADSESLLRKRNWAVFGFCVWRCTK